MSDDKSKEVKPVLTIKIELIIILQLCQYQSEIILSFPEQVREEL